MWTRNIDTGKWVKQSDTLSKESYDNLKVDLDRVKLYSKCLSGATYLTINDFDNLYPQLDQEKIGFYNGFYQPLNGPQIKITDSNSDEFYDKYLKEDAFTLKNLFTPEKLLEDQGKNSTYVDVATTVSFTFSASRNITVDGVQLISGHRVLVKDQKSVITLSSSIDPEDYFTNTLPVSNYTVSSNNVTSITYEYYNNLNGVYKYDGFNITKEDDLSEYNKSYKLVLSVKLGDTNADKQFHLQRLKNGYFSIDGDAVEFKEQQSWVLRNRVDYNNIYDLSYYDIKNFAPQQIFDRVNSKTYSIPERTIAVGEFGVILNNQDKYSITSTYSISNIISNKYKVNLKSIDGTNDHYWVCGDEGVLLRISKIDFTIEQVDLGEDLNLTSMSFFNDLYGMVVGKFNTIYFTRDGGYKWTKVQYDEFEKYSYNKVVHFSANQVYIGGEAGIFIEMVYSNDTWLAYKRKVAKQLSTIDEYILVEDITDMYPTNYTNIKQFTYSNPSTVSSLENSIVYKTKLTPNNELEVSIESPYLNSSSFLNSGSELRIFCSFSYAGGSGYVNPEFGTSGDPISYDFYSSFNIFSLTFSLPKNSSGNIYEGTYGFSFDVRHNYNITDPYNPYSLYTQSFTSFETQAKSGNLLLISGNNETVLCYDINKVINTITNDFVYLSFSQSFSDGITISKRNGLNEVYLGGDKIYNFKLGDFVNILDSTTNLAKGELTLVDDNFANKIYTESDRIWLAGNASLTKVGTYSNSFSDLDPSFNDRIKSKFLVLDYDIGSKLNFFDDDRNYRLPDPISFDSNYFTVSGTTFSIQSFYGEKSWIDYYSDSEKTFAYNSSIEDSTVVKFSNEFSYDPYATSFTASKIGNKLTDFDYAGGTLAPHFLDNTSSEFIGSSGSIVDQFKTDYDILLYKNLSIIKRSYFTVGTNTDYDNYSDKTKVGDVINLTSNIVDANLVVNKVLYYASSTVNGNGYLTQSKPSNIVGLARLDTYLYAYSNFNENIINNLKKSTKDIVLKNLNRYKDQDDLVSNFNSHPLGTGYKLTNNSDSISIQGLFNEKTAYYNLQSEVKVNDEIKNLLYKESFLDFGFTPTYNISTFLNKINPEIFLSTKEFKILPQHFGLNGNDTSSATDNNIYIDSNSPSNVLRFGTNYYFEWRSLLINTFVDIVIKTSITDYISEQFLITEKYYDTDTDAYYLKFNKRINLPKSVGAKSFDIKTRNTLSDISIDLQLLNNIQRSTLEKTVQSPKTFTNYESSIKTKFSTESYLKAFVSDYDIKQNITAILYNDSEFQVSMNVLNVEREVTYEINQIIPRGGDGKMLFLAIGANDEIKVGDLVFIEIDNVLNSPMAGYQTVIYANSNTIVTSKDYYTDQFIGSGTLKVIKKDPFFNYQPVDVFRAGSDKKVTKSVEILPKNVKLDGKTYSLINLDLNKFKIELIDGLSLEEVSRFYHWILEAEVSNALIGKDKNGIIWYSGTWRCGRWFGGTWISGKWLSGDWYAGTWNAFTVINNIISAKVDTSYTDEKLSKWYNGRWFDGTWNNGIWYNGRRYAGDWKLGTWFNGIWNDGHWFGGNFNGGIWVDGTWDSGIFNCNSKPAYWIYGKFISGDFENGIWYNGQFGNDVKVLSRFGTKASNSRTATWHGGKWVDGEFYSSLNIDRNTGLPIVSEIHKYSIWRTGIWANGNWYGGIAFNIDFRGGIWHGGILEEIQVIGIDSILPATYSTNKIYVNGIFKFNPGDEIWMIDDDRNTPFSPLGNNDKPMKYRINQIVEDSENGQTGIFLNYNLSLLGVQDPYASKTYSITSSDGNVDLGLRVVSYFKDVTWKSGLWTNGIFDGKQFDSGIWYNGIFDGNWGN